jgi:CRISPR-associated endonuclease Csy4
MNYYQELSLLPDTDITIGFIWQKVYQQIHIALVENKVGENESAIAISFPAYGGKGYPIGNKIRLFAETKEQLADFNIHRWLSRLQDYVHIKSINLVPDNVKQVCFVRKHAKGQARIEKDMQVKAEHWANKSGKSIVECLGFLEKSKPNVELKLPYIWLESQETKSRGVNSKFPLFIKMVEVEESNTGPFNCYGLSKGNKEGILATVPHF